MNKSINEGFPGIFDVWVTLFSYVTISWATEPRCIIFPCRALWRLNPRGGWGSRDVPTQPQDEEWWSDPDAPRKTDSLGW